MQRKEGFHSDSTPKVAKFKAVANTEWREGVSQGDSYGVWYMLARM